MVSGHIDKTGWEQYLIAGNSIRYPYYGYTGYGDDYTPYRFLVTRDGVTREILDSVFIKSYETFSDTIYYYFPEEGQ